MKRKRILIVDDHEIFRFGIKSILEKMEQYQVVGEAANGAIAIEMVQHLRPDIVLLDLHMPYLDGVLACRQILNLIPSIKIVALSMEEDKQYIEAMVEAGSHGYVLKNASPAELDEALTKIYQHTIYLSPSVRARLTAKRKPHRVSKPRSPVKKIVKLSKRELEILQYIAEEMTNKEIASKLFLSPRTVDTHRRNLLQKLKVKNTAGLVKYYLTYIESETTAEKD